MNNLFHIIEDANVILHSKGVFYQKKVYRYGNRLFAGWGGGFIRLGVSGLTSNPNVKHENLDIPPSVALGKDEVGNPTIIMLAVPNQQRAA